MSVHTPPAYLIPGGDRPLTHSRIAHSGNWVSGTPGASSTDASGVFFEDAPANSLVMEKWRAAAGGAQVWALTFDGPASIDYCVIAVHDLGRVGASVAIEVDAGAGWVEVMPAFAPAGDGAIFAIFPPVVGAVAARLVLTIPGDVPEIGFVRFGMALQMEERSQYAGRTPFELARAVRMTGNRAVRGAFLSRVKIRAGLPLSFAWSYLSEAWCDAHLPELRAALESDLFVIADRPDGRPDDVALCWVSGDVPSPVAAGAMDLQNFSLTAEGYLSD